MLQQLGWARSAYARECREQLEAERRRDAIEVPGLSAEALAAIKNLENAAAWTPQQARGPDQAAKVAAAWAAVAGSQPVQEELSRFRELASARLGAGRTDYEPPDFQRVRRLVGIVVEAERVHEEYAAQTARQETERAAAVKRQADAEATLNEWRPHPRGLRPSSDPSP